MLESGAERSAPGGLFAAPDTASRSRRWLGFSKSKDLAAESDEQTNE